MREAIESERQESDRQRRFAQHHLFHAVLLDAAGNRLIHLMTVPIFRVIRSRFLHNQSRPFWGDVDDDHERLLASAGPPAGLPKRALSGRRGRRRRVGSPSSAGV